MCEIWKLYHYHSKAKANVKVVAANKQTDRQADRPKTGYPLSIGARVERVLKVYTVQTLSYL